MSRCALPPGRGSRPRSTEANGYVGYELPMAPGQQLWISGCATLNGQPFDGSLSLQAPQSMVGTATIGKAQYNDGVDSYATDTDVTLTVTAIDETTIFGAYTAQVMTINNETKAISGSFGVCRVIDFLPP